jgi:AraC-like DNA-binding protein
MPFSTITSWARLIWEGLQSHGVDADAVFREAGLDPGALKDSGARYPVESMGRLWQLAELRSSDPCFGLTAAEQWYPTTWHGLGYAWLASATLEEALRRLVRYSAVISTAADFRLVELEDRFRLVLTAHRESGLEPSAVVMDAVTANVVHMCRVTYGEDFNPVRIELRHSGVGCRTRRREFFRCPIQYDADEIAVEIDRKVACKPLSTANADLAHANERVISDYLAELGGGRVAMRVRARLVDRLPSGDVTEKNVAESLHMSARSLQRRLNEENTTYKEVLEETRRQLAERFIRDRSLTFNEITYLLGFSEISSFSRSFKRWTGMAPTAYRRETESA